MPHPAGRLGRTGHLVHRSAVDAQRRVVLTHCLLVRCLEQTVDLSLRIVEQVDLPHPERIDVPVQGSLLDGGECVRRT